MKVKRSRIPRMILGTALCLGALGLAPSAALASSPLPAPTNLQAAHVADTSADPAPWSATAPDWAKPATWVG
jgi:hypothetical protein